MQSVIVLFAPGLDAALVEFIDHVDRDSIPTVLDVLERIKTRLRDTEAFPESGPVFHGEELMFPVEGHVFLYEHQPAKNDVHVLDMIGPGRNRR